MPTHPQTQVDIIRISAVRIRYHKPNDPGTAVACINLHPITVVLLFNAVRVVKDVSCLTATRTDERRSAALSDCHGCHHLIHELTVWNTVSFGLTDRRMDKTKECGSP